MRHGFRGFRGLRGTLKGVGRIDQQLYTDKTPVAAADRLNGVLACFTEPGGLSSVKSVA